MIEIYDEESILFKYKGEERKYSCLYSQPPMLLQMVSSFYDNYFNTLNMDITKIQIEQLIVYIVNAICYLKNKDEDYLCNSLLNSIIILNKFKKDVDNYNKDNNINNNDNNSNKDNRINNIDNNINKENNINNNGNNSNKDYSINNNNKDYNSNNNNIIGVEEVEDDYNIICTSTKKKNMEEQK